MGNMSRQFIFIVLMVPNILLYYHQGFAQKSNKSKKKQEESVSLNEEGRLQNEIKYYNVITPLSKSDSGLFLVHQVDEKYYFEIPDSLLERDMLLVSRIAQIPQGFGGDYINAGSKIHEQVVRWERKYNRVLLRTKSYLSIAGDSLPIHISVQVNNYEPILHAFEIKSYSPDSNNLVIDVTPFYTSDINAIAGLSEEMRKEYKVSKLDEDRSFIERITSYPLNIEVRHELTYVAGEPPIDNGTATISILMNQSMVLLPEKPMLPRYHDPRVGWFTLNQIDYGSGALKADAREIIRRWRLEPSDKEAYMKGELVEPVKPIVYYIDPATPEIWRPYFKQGIELWQQVFETAGFKNAIIARDPPDAMEDPEFSAEDVRYSVVRYVASTTRNAMGPSVVDPRSGEIIESDIMWYHNHFRTYRNRFMIETGAANPAARTLNTPLEEMGEMIKMVIAHEVGHALGLPHNMKASSAYPVDSLRSGYFTSKFGIAASIMDYARFNYVAQPGDEGIRFIRQMGPYDHYAINWGYRWIPEILDPAQEKPELDAWILGKEGDPVYRFGSGKGGYDPSAQTENLGDDPVKASGYGLQNLKVVSENLVGWTTEEGADYTDLDELYNELVRIWAMYNRQVMTNIGGLYQILKNADQEGNIYEFVPKEIQSASMSFLLDHLFTTPNWLLRQDILLKIEPSGAVNRINQIQSLQLKNLLEKDRLVRLIEGESFLGRRSYSCLQMMDDLRGGIWKDLIGSQSPDVYTRNLQIIWIGELSKLLNRSLQNDDDQVYADIHSIALKELNAVRATLEARKASISDLMARSHYAYCLKLIDDSLEYGLKSGK